MYDSLGNASPSGANWFAMFRAILERKYGGLFGKARIESLAETFRDDPLRLRPPKYHRKQPVYKLPGGSGKNAIALIVNESHSIHHVRDRGYVEAPVRVSVIMQELDKTALFKRINPVKIPDRLLKKVHDPEYVDYLAAPVKCCHQGNPYTRLFSRYAI